MTNIVDVQTLQTWLSTNEAILIDVREADEFKADHIPSALSLPLSQLNDSLGKFVVPTNAKIVFQCLSGKRSGNACGLALAKLPQGAGVYTLEGGISSWKAAGNPTVGAAVHATKFSIFRQVQMIVGSMIALFVLLGFVQSNPVFFGLAGVFGGMLASAGLTGWCGLALLLQKAPWNR